MAWTSSPVTSLKGVIRAPGDKSCSHRALILGALAEGESRFSGLLEGDDVLRTGTAMAELGAEVEQIGPGRWRVIGVGERGLQSAGLLDFGNSGTGSRLIMGVVTGFPIIVGFTGDESLRARPMDRILLPLRQMGLKDDAAESGTRLPFTLYGGDAIKAINYAPPVASAQVKSAIMLAGLNAEGTTIVREAKATRDHTERMLRGFGADVDVRREGAGRVISLMGGQRLSGIESAVPGDPSSAAFLLTAGLISPDGDVTVEGVLSNDTRSGYYDLLARMGATLGAEDVGEACGERLINLQASHGSLKGTEVPERLVPAMIDEFPILGVLAAFASGETVVTGAEELRVKESDRIGAVVAMLCANGVNADERPDGFIVEGCGGPPPGGGLVETRHDHRIAMSALVMGTAAQAPISVDDISMIATSYPDFLSHMAALGADIQERTA